MQKQFFKIGVLIAMSFAQSMNGQWVSLNSGTTNTLYDVHFPGTDTGYAVGYNGTILKTVDAGTTWVSLNSQSSIAINSVHFIDGITGLAVGDSGTIFKTSDGGNSWSRDSINASYKFEEVHFVNSSVGFIAGNHIADPVLLKTTDSGANWNMVTILDSVSSDFQINSVHFPTPDTGYAVFRSGVLRSIDGGDNWSLLVYYVGGLDSIFPFSILESCYFTDANTGYIGGWYNAALSKTTDAGNTWMDVRDPSTGPFQIYSIHFPGMDTGYAVGWYGEIYSTANAGNSWTKQTIGTGIFYSVYFTDLTIGYAVGDNGTIIKTTNGGLSGSEFFAPKQRVEIFPNPSAATINIKIEGALEILQVFLTDLKGREIKSFTKDAHLLDVSGIANGTYLLKIKTSEGELIRKIILQ